MDITVLTTEVKQSCKEMSHRADDCAKLWGAAKALHGNWQDGKLDQTVVVDKLWECKTQIQQLLGRMQQQMLNVHLLISGALAALPHQEAKNTFLQAILDDLLHAQMAGNQADGAADMVTEMLRDVVNHPAGT